MILDCLESDILPDNQIYSHFHNFIAYLDIALLFFSLLIFYKSPPSKESRTYGCIAFFQFISLFCVSFIWTLIAKFHFYPKLGIVYAEGLVTRTSMNSGQIYSIVSFFFGIYLSSLQAAYLYRLRLIAHRDHLIQNSSLFYGYMIIIIPFFSFALTTSFYLAYVTDINDEENPIRNLCMEMAQFFIQKRYFWFPYLRSFSLSYLFIFGFSLVYSSSSLLLVSTAIVLEFRKQEAISSSSTIKHHRNVWKSLMIQTIGTLLIMIPSPFTVFTQIFIEGYKSLTPTAICLFGLCFSVNASILLLLNVTYRKTIKSLFCNPIMSGTPSRASITRIKARIF